tara:strand:- start:361 stop:720 length:360 start_codon:yes stop_codon:yes gene_type:complete
MLFTIFLRSAGEILEHDITNDYLNSTGDTSFKVSQLVLEEYYIVGRIVESIFYFLSALIIVPILIYHLYKYHPEDFNKIGIGFILYGSAISVVNIITIVSDEVLYLLIGNFIEIRNSEQ